MGQVSLLTREGEVEIAQRIEAGSEAQIRAVVASPFGLSEVLRLGDELRKGQRPLSDLVDGLELLVERGEHERLPTLQHPLRRKDKPQRKQG